jgi:hypothetical protein
MNKYTAYAVISIYSFYADVHFLFEPKFMLCTYMYILLRSRSCKTSVGHGIKEVKVSLPTGRGGPYSRETSRLPHCPDTWRGSVVG